MATCDVCGKEVTLPFKCRYCGGTFCSEHRLPENHSCKEITKARPPERERVPWEATPKRGPEWTPSMEMRFEIRAPRLSRLPSFWKDFFFRQASMVILLAIFVAFIGQLIAQVALGPRYYTPGNYDTFLYYLTPSPATILTRPWTLLTSIFLHAGFPHLLVNGMVLFFFGPTLEARIGRKRFTYLFLGAGALAAAVQLLFIPSSGIILGASGAILGVLGALTVLAPRLPVLLFFFIPMPLWMVTVGFGAVSAVLALYDSAGSIAHMAHLIGIVVGLLYGHKLKRDERKSYTHFMRQFFGPWI